MNLKKLYVYPAIFHPEETGYSVFFPDLQGCHTQGEDLEDATLMAQEALATYLEYILDEGTSCPTPSSPEQISITGKDFIAMINANMFNIMDKTSGKAIKKTLTIPAWLNDEAEKQHINFSSLLKEALIERIQK